MGWTISYPLKGSGYIVSTHLSFDKARDKSSTSFQNLARDCQFKGFPELARFFNSHYYEKLPYSTGSRSTIELPRNKLFVQPFSTLTRLQKMFSYNCFPSRSIFFKVDHNEWSICTRPSVTANIMLMQSIENIF